jgi:hypothetical protein
VSKPRVLVLDIETAPATAYVWRLFDENISLDQLIAPSRIICWGAKWIGSSEFIYADERKGHGWMLGKIHTMLSDADAVVTYNGDRFDLPKLYGEFIAAGLPPLPPCTSIDVIKTVRKMGVQSNKLAFIGPHLKIGKKMQAGGFLLWRAILEGSKQAWDKMKRYNRQDVLLLERLYKVLRPHMRNHPYMGKGSSRPVSAKILTRECPVCESLDHQRRGTRRTKSYLIERIQCLGCGGWYDGSRTRMGAK